MEVWDQGNLREIGWGSVEWIQLAQDRDQWRAVVNTMMNLRASRTVEVATRFKVKPVELFITCIKVCSSISGKSEDLEDKRKA
jgi:hypothetical protein